MYISQFYVKIEKRKGGQKKADERSEEAWMSGLNQRFTKPPNLNRFREFESHRLRKKKKTRKGFSFCGRERELLLFRVRFEELFFFRC